MPNPAGPWTPTDTTREKILKSQFDWDSDTWKCALFLSTSNIGVASTTYAGITNEHPNANGYTTGGVAVTFAFVGTTSVAVSFVSNPQWVALGGSITARFSGIYEVSGDLAFYCLLDITSTDVTVTAGNQLTINSNGIPNPVYIFA